MLYSAPGRNKVAYDLAEIDDESGKKSGPKYEVGCPLTCLYFVRSRVPPT